MYHTQDFPEISIRKGKSMSYKGILISDKVAQTPEYQ
jgi:hypothetical protein